MSLSLVLLLLTVMLPDGVTVQTEPLSVADGELSVPSDPDAIGVYQLHGNLLLVAHVDWPTPQGVPMLRVGDTFRHLQPDDPIQLSDGRSYHVAWTSDWQPGDDWSTVVAPGLDELTLLTCDGPFSLSRHAYLYRTVVRAVRDVHPISEDQYE